MINIHKSSAQSETTRKGKPTYHVRLAPNQQVVEKPGLTLRPRDGIRVLISRGENTLVPEINQTMVPASC